MISGIKSLRVGGRLVYSTCTITPEENEGVLDQVLRKFDLELEEIDLPGVNHRPALAEAGGTRFHPEVAKAVRLYPHETGTEGFFIASIRKRGRCGTSRLNRPPELHQDELDTASSPEVSRFLGELEQRFGLDSKVFRDKAYRRGRDLYWVNEEACSFPCYMPLVSAGYPLAHVRSGPAKLTTEAIHAIGRRISRNGVELSDFSALEDFVNREDLDFSEMFREDIEQVVASFRGFPIGHGIISRGRLLSRFPRVGWNFSIDD